MARFEVIPSHIVTFDYSEEDDENYLPYKILVEMSENTNVYYKGSKVEYFRKSNGMSPERMKQLKRENAYLKRENKRLEFEISNIEFKCKYENKEIDSESYQKLSSYRRLLMEQERQIKELKIKLYDSQSSD